MKQGFKKWFLGKKIEITQTKSNNLDYLIDLTFRNINRLFSLSFKNANNDPTRDSLEKHYMSLVQIKDVNALIDNKKFCDYSVKDKQEPYEKIIEMSKNGDYTIGNLLDFSYHQICYELIATDLSRQTIRIFLDKLTLQEN